MDSVNNWDVMQLSFLLFLIEVCCMGFTSVQHWHFSPAGR